MFSINNALRAIFLMVIISIITTSNCLAETSEINIPASGGMSAMKNLNTDFRLYCFIQYQNGRTITKADELKLEPKMSFPKELIGIQNIDDYPNLIAAFQTYQKGISVEFKSEMLQKKFDSEDVKSDAEKSEPKIPVISLIAKNDLSFEIKSSPDIQNMVGIVTIQNKNGETIAELKTPPFKWEINDQTKPGNYLVQGSVSFDGKSISTTPSPIVINEKTIIKKTETTNSAYPSWLTLNRLIITTVVMLVIVLYLMIFQILPIIQRVESLNRLPTKTTG
jgi:hypothetical protein